MMPVRGPGDDGARRDVAAVGAVEDQDAVRGFAAAQIDAIGHDDDVVDAVDGHAVDVPDLRLRTAQLPDRRGVAGGGPRKHEHAVVARIHDHLVVRDVDVERVGLDQAGGGPLQDAQRRRAAVRAARQRQHRAAERDRHHDLVVRRVVEDAVHRPADARGLSGNHARRFRVPVCQPGKRRDSRLADSIGNEQLVALRVVGDGARVAEADGGRAGGRVADDPLRRRHRRRRRARRPAPCDRRSWRPRARRS